MGLQACPESYPFQNTRRECSDPFQEQAHRSHCRWCFHSVFSKCRYITKNQQPGLDSQASPHLPSFPNFCVSVPCPLFLKAALPTCTADATSIWAADSTREGGKFGQAEQLASPNAVRTAGLTSRGIQHSKTLDCEPSGGETLNWSTQKSVPCCSQDRSLQITTSLSFPATCISENLPWSSFPNHLSKSVL